MRVMLETVADVRATGVDPRLAKEARRALRKKAEVQLEKWQYPGTGEEVQTLILGGERAVQVVGEREGVATGVWDEVREVILADSACAAYGLDGDLAFGDEAIWLDGVMGAGGDGELVELVVLLGSGEVQVAGLLVDAVAGWLENRVEDSRANEAACRAEGTYVAAMPALLPRRDRNLLVLPLDTVVMGAVLDVLGTATRLTHEGWDRRGARELRGRLEEALDAGQLSPELRALGRTSRSAFGQAAAGRRGPSH